MDLIPAALAASTGTTTASPAFSDYFTKIALGLVVFGITFAAANLLRAWVHRIIQTKQGDQHKEIRVLYGRVVFFGTLFIGVMIGLTVMGAPLEWFSGGIGLGLAFALRDLLANFFAGIILLANNKFNIGDFVIIDAETKGTIVDIRARATSLRAIDGGEITIPNVKMLDSNVKCYTKNPIRRHAIPIGVGYGSNLKTTCELLKKTIAANPSVQPKPGPTVLVKEVADSAVILEARFWTESRTKWWVVKSDLTRDIFNALNAAGIDIPYPVQTLRVDEASSAILAQQPHLLENLENIEKAKNETQKNFIPAPANS